MAGCLPSVLLSEDCQFTVNGVAVFTEPSGVVTVMVPVAAPLGTNTTNCVPEPFAVKLLALAL